MINLEELRPVLRAVVADGGDVVDVALAIRAHNVEGWSVQIARLLRDEFELSIPEALAIAAWAQGTGDEGAREDLRKRVRSPLRGR